MLEIVAGLIAVFSAIILVAHAIEPTGPNDWACLYAASPMRT